MSMYPQLRLRRTRKTDWCRRLVRETRLSPDDLIWPLIVSDSAKTREPIASMPGVERLSIKECIKAAERAEVLGIPALALFPNISAKYKDTNGTEALNSKGLIPEAVRAIKAAVPNIGIIVDVALDPYTDHGHDGVLHEGEVLNDPSVAILSECAVMLADAGADIVAPSDMMDGRVGAIRSALEDHGHKDVLILSYAAKYASGFYGPYRDAIGTSASLSGDKRTYQMDPANRDEALREAGLDVEEGADMLMVKPGLPYLDIIRDLKQAFQMPTFAFQVSGEYAMIKAAGANGWLDEDRVKLENLSCFKRAGADGVLTYFAPEIAQLLNE